MVSGLPDPPRPTAHTTLGCWRGRAFSPRGHTPGPASRGAVFSPGLRMHGAFGVWGQEHSLPSPDPSTRVLCHHVPCLPEPGSEFPEWLACSQEPWVTTEGLTGAICPPCAGPGPLAPSPLPLGVPQTGTSVLRTWTSARTGSASMPRAGTAASVRWASAPRRTTAPAGVRPGAAGLGDAAGGSRRAGHQEQAAGRGGLTWGPHRCGRVHSREPLHVRELREPAWNVPLCLQSGL